MSSNFRRAAEKLNISQPTLTSQINSLEESLGSQLFERSRAGTLLSSNGRMLLPMARQVLDQYQQLLDQASNSTRELTGTFKMGVAPTVGPYLLPEILPELHRRYPKLKLHVQEAIPKELEDGLDKGRFDFILTILPMSSNENKVRPLFIEPIHLTTPIDHPFAVEHEITAKDLYDQDVLAMGEHHHLHKQVAMLCERFGARVQRDFEGSSLATLQQMVVMGMGITFLPALYLRAKDKEMDNMKLIYLRDELIVRTHVASWRQNSPARHLFQKLSYDIKIIAMDVFEGILEEVNTDENT